MQNLYTNYWKDYSTDNKKTIKRTLVIKWDWRISITELKRYNESVQDVDYTREREMVTKAARSKRQKIDDTGCLQNEAMARLSTAEQRTGEDLH